MPENLQLLSKVFDEMQYPTPNEDDDSSILQIQQWLNFDFYFLRKQHNWIRNIHYGVSMTGHASIDHGLWSDRFSITGW